jgi:hypothetical protein
MLTCIAAPVLAFVAFSFAFLHQPQCPVVSVPPALQVLLVLMVEVSSYVRLAPLHACQTLMLGDEYSFPTPSERVLHVVAKRLFVGWPIKL